MYNQTELEHYVGHEHREELAALITAGEGALPHLHFKNPKVALILSILVGIIGIDRFYQGGIKMLLIKISMIILTFGTWYIADIYFCRKMIQMDNYQKLIRAVNG